MSAPGPGVVMLTPNFHPHIGGAEKQALEVSKTLASRGLAVRVLTRRLPGQNPEDQVDGIPVHRRAAWGGGFFNAAVFLVSSFFFLLRRAADYDVIHVHLAGSPALAACLAGRLLGKRVVVKVGGGRGIGEIALSSKTPAGRLKLALLRIFKPHFAAVTRDLAAEMTEHGLRARVSVVPNGVDIRRYHPVEAGRRAALRTELGWPDGLCFLYVGRLAPEKRLDRFLKAFARLTTSLPGCGVSSFCVFAGSGPEEEALRAEAGLLGLGSRVRFMGPTRRIARVYGAADVFVLPSVSEGLSNALLEAMASGLAVFGSRVGGTKEVVADGRTGLLFDPDDDEDLGAQLRKFFENKNLAPALGRGARAAAIEGYSAEKVADRYMELYGMGRGEGWS